MPPCAVSKEHILRYLSFRAIVEEGKRTFWKKNLRLPFTRLQHLEKFPMVEICYLEPDALAKDKVQHYLREITRLNIHLLIMAQKLELVTDTVKWILSKVYASTMDSSPKSSLS